MSRFIKEEYAMLREEIMENMKSQNNLSTFVSTTICTFIGVVIALDQPSPFLYLIPFLILIPASFKESNYQRRVAYLASYLIVYLEGEDSFLWETRYHHFARRGNPSLSSKFRAALETLEFTLFGILCYVLFLWRYPFPCFSSSAASVAVVLKEIFLIVVPLLLIVIIAWNMFNYWNFRKLIQKNIIAWKRLKRAECHRREAPSRTPYSNIL